jgi:putative effector of murein hydrolase LrgA (UPF0299 family)
METPIHRSWLNVVAKSRSVVSHHFASEWNGRPLFLMIPGGVAAVVAGLWIFFLAKSVWVDHLHSVDAARPQLIALLAVYFAGLAVFSYAYELYNWRRAICLTLVLGVVGLAIIYVGLAIASVLRCLLSTDHRRRSDSDANHASPIAAGFYGEHPEGAGSGPDGNILSLATCPLCGQSLRDIGVACPSCIAKAAGLTSR